MDVGRVSAVAQPFLFRYRTKQGRPSSTGILAGCAYDHIKNLIVRTTTGLPAIWDCTLRPLVTKKADVEKGEDRKDTWL